MEIFEVIDKRASLKAHFSSREVEQEKILKVLNAARLAPSARNTQPWRFIVIKDKKIIENLVSKAFGETNRVAANAPVLIIACADPNEDIIRDGKEYYLFDVALAMENILLAATDLGLLTHLMAGVNEDELKKILGIPDNMRFVVATPLAYPVEGSYEEAARERLSERIRKSVQELVYSNEWAKPF